MKSGILVLMLCTALLVPVAVSAGDGHRGMKAHKMAKELNLSDGQKSQLKTIHTEAKTQRQAIKDMPETERKAAAQKLRTDTKTKTANVLTAEQRQKLDELKAAHKAKKN